MKAWAVQGKEADTKPFQALGKESVTPLTRMLRCRLGAEYLQAVRIQSKGKGPLNKFGRTSLTGDDVMGFELTGKKGANILMGVWGAASAQLEMRN